MGWGRALLLWEIGNRMDMYGFRGSELERRAFPKLGKRAGWTVH